MGCARVGTRVTSSAAPVVWSSRVTAIHARSTHQAGRIASSTAHACRVAV